MRPAVLGLVVLLFSGCATLFAGGPDHVPVSTNPPGATVFVDGVPVGQTPMLLTLDRQHNTGTIRLELPGFAPITLLRDQGINGWFWANLCVGAWPMIIDLITGDDKAFDDTPIAVGMTPMGAYPGPQGYPQGPQGYPQQGPQGYPQQGPQGYPQQGPQPYPQGPQAYPQGPQAYPQGPQAYPQGPQAGPQGPPGGYAPPPPQPR
ncbi:MAG TPA: PEGA domain-containing protein [Kofleriaceae bacterium]|jgi:hypothetical protein|nr:PEGA domain-containing protein [Kofleriaceae bacterium]